MSERKFYRSTAWRKCRNAYRLHANSVCERCGQPGVIVHHKQEITDDNADDPEITMSFGNLELLCLDCHNKEHFEQGKTRDGLIFDETGDLIKKS